MIPFDKTGNVYAIATLCVSNALNQLNKLERQAEETIMIEPLLELQTEIMLALEKFQKTYPGNEKG